MRLRNRRGRPVDPVPFIVVVGLAFMLLLSFGPLYGQALGAPLETAIGASFGAFVVVALAAYHRHVWIARSDGVDIPAPIRAERLFYLMVVLGAVVIGLAVPFTVR